MYIYTYKKIVLYNIMKTFSLTYCFENNVNKSIGF